MCREADQLFREGYELCFESSDQDRVQGRETLRRSAWLGRDDALLYLGKSFEEDQDFSAAEEAYSEGMKRKYRAAIFRLAVLHGRGLAQDSDRDFYLRTIKALSRDGHFPSIALYTNERLRGSYGLVGAAMGFVSVIPNAFRFMWTFARNPKSPRFEQ